MKKTTFAEENCTVLNDLFTEDFTSENQLAINQNFSLQETIKPNSELILDTLLSVVKWVFFYLPGVFVIHMAMMVPALMFFYDDFRLIELFKGFGFLLFGVFLVMLGFGKLRDLKYLKTVLAIIAFSFLSAVFYDVLAVLIKGDFLGLYSKITILLVAVIGFLSKRSLDADDND